MGYLASRYPGGRRVLARDVVQRYGLERTRMARRLVAQQPVLSLWLVLGDLDLDLLDLDAHQADARIGLTSRAAERIHGLLVTGSLTVRGSVLSGGHPGGMSLFVGGQLRAANLAVSGVELLVAGDSRVGDVLCCSGGAGEAWFDGDVRARLAISDDAAIRVGGALRAPVLDTGNSRVEVRDGARGRPVPGDVPIALVLSDDALSDDGSQLAFPRLHALLAAARPALRSDFRDGKIDLDAMRERRELLRQAGSAMQRRRYSSAAGLFRTALAAGAPAGPVGIGLVDALYRVHQLTGDRSVLREALTVLDGLVDGQDTGQPPVDRADLARVLVLRACVLLQLDESQEVVERARADHARALKLDPDRARLTADDLAELFSLIGRWLYARRQYRECVDVLRHALAERQDHEQANGTVARALWMVGREVEAIPYATRSLRVNPGDDFIWFVRGKCRQRLGDHGQARTDLHTYLELHPDDEFTAEALVETAFDSHRPELAVDEARRFAASRPLHADAHARLGRLLRARGRPADAVPLLRAVLELDGVSADTVQRATRDLGVALLALGGDVDGLERAMRTVELATPPDHQTYLRGECYRILGDLTRAEVELSDYLRERPDSPGAIASLAMVQLATGRAEDAFRSIDRARHLAPDDGYVERCAAVLAA